MSLLSLRCMLILHIGSKLYRRSPKTQKVFRRQTSSWLDELFFNILQELQVKSFLECGAHEASASMRFMKSIGDNAVAVEANPLTFSEKTLPSQKYGVKAINCGVGQMNGTLDFYIPVEHKTAGYASFRTTPGVEYVTEKIALRTIDKIVLEEFGRVHSFALWVDVEGLALEVLQGGEALLDGKECLVIKVEVETSELFTGQSLAGDVDEFLRGKDFVPVACDFEYENQFNVIYIKRKFADKIDTIVLAAFAEFDRLEIPLMDKVFRGLNLRDVKLFLLKHSNRKVANVAHRVAARMGSLSSKEILEKRNSLD